MIKKALEYINGLSEAKIVEIDGSTYTDKVLSRVSYNPLAEPIQLSTITSLIEYIKQEVDTLKDGKMIIHVESPTSIKLFTSLDNERKREHMLHVRAIVPEFDFNTFIQHEKFCINVQSKFIDHETTDRALLLKFAGTIENGTLATYGDDGVTQKATVKTGIASKSEALVPNPVILKPYRTFTEVDQPISSFIFRMKEDKYDGITCALYEADGGAWRNEAIHNIKTYLENELKDFKGRFIILA